MTLELYNGKHGLSITAKEDGITYAERNMSENKEFNILLQNFKRLPEKNETITVSL